MASFLETSVRDRARSRRARSPSISPATSLTNSKAKATCDRWRTAPASAWWWSGPRRHFQSAQRSCRRRRRAWKHLREYRWYVDPLDVHDELRALLSALQRDARFGSAAGEMIAGVIFDPSREEMFAAETRGRRRVSQQPSYSRLGGQASGRQPAFDRVPQPQSARERERALLLSDGAGQSRHTPRRLAAVSMPPWVAVRAPGSLLGIRPEPVGHGRRRHHRPGSRRARFRHAGRAPSRSAGCTYSWTTVSSTTKCSLVSPTSSPASTKFRSLKSSKPVNPGTDGTFSDLPGSGATAHPPRRSTRSRSPSGLAST